MTSCEWATVILPHAGPVDERRIDWERRTGVPLMAAGLLFLSAYAIPILWPHANGALLQTCAVVEWGVWAVFVLDLGVRLRLACDRTAFVRGAWLDFALLLLPMLRPLRPLRAVVALNVFGRRGGPFVRGRVVTSVVTAVAFVAVVGALAVLDAERQHPEAAISTIGDALWWAAVTVTTVGYGDLTPITTEGRLVAIALMVTGIGLLGVITATIASWFVEQIERVEEDTTAKTADDLNHLMNEVRALRRELESRPRPDENQAPGR